MVSKYLRTFKIHFSITVMLRPVKTKDQGSNPWGGATYKVIGVIYP
jgi:hypothetical protein